MIGMEIACFPIVLWVLGEMLAGAAIQQAWRSLIRLLLIMSGIEIACFPIVLLVLSGNACQSSKHCRILSKGFYYDWYRDSLFSYCVVSSNLFNGTLYPEIIKTNFCLIY